MAGKNDDQLPEIFNDGQKRIYHDSTRTIFIEDIKTGVSMQLNSHPHGGLEFTTNGRVETFSIYNSTLWHIVPRR